MNHLTRIGQALTEVYTRKIYVLVTLLFSFLVFAFNVLVINYQIIVRNFSFELMIGLMAGTFSMMALDGQVFLVLISVLSGIVLSMSMYLIKRQFAGSLGVGSSSFLVSIAAPSCPSCAIGLFSAVGLGGFLTILPFKGLELRLLAVGVLALSLVYLSNKITTRTCVLRRKTK